MANQDTTATADKTNESEALEDRDPGMEAFLQDQKTKEGTAKTEEETSQGDESEDESKSNEEEEQASSESEDESEEADESEGESTSQDSKAQDDSSAKKEENRIGYQLRQIRAGDPFVAKARKALQDDYVNAEGLSEEQREIRQMKADNYIEKLETSRAQLVADNQTVAEEYPFFRPLNPDGTKNPEFNEALYKRAIDRFSRDSLEMSDPDENGVQQIVGYKVRLLDYMREEADLYLAGRSQNEGKTKSEDKPADKPKDDKKSKAKTDASMDAASEDPGGASTAKTESEEEEKDPIVRDFFKGFDSV